MPQNDVLQKLGEGGRGQVYLTEAAGRGRVARKVLAPEHVGEEGLGFFRSEVALLSRLSHPNLVRLFDYEEGPPPAYTMEYVDGVTLDRALPTLPIAAVLNVFVECARALHYLHARGLLHRDLKPANILVTKQGSPKILDFGLPGVGTPAYWAPEAQAGRYDSQSDLFALGVSFRESLEGRKDTPSYFQDLLDRLVRPNPSERPVSSLSLIKFLNRHVASPFDLQTDEATATILQKIPWVPRSEEAELRKMETTSPMIIVTGPTGIGRSRLLEEIAWRRKLAGLPTLFWPDLHRASEDALKQAEIRIRAEKRRHPAPLLILEYDSDLAGTSCRALIERIVAIAEGRAASLVLKDLSRSEALEFVGRATENHPLKEDDAEKIVDAAGGRPLLLIESLKASTADPDTRRTLPKNMSEAAAARVSQLSDAARDLLALILTSTLPPTTADLLSAWTKSPLLFQDTVLELRQKGFLDEPDEGNAFRLLHPSLAGAYEAALEPALPVTAHRSWLKALHAKDAEPIADGMAPRVVRHAVATHNTALIRRWTVKAIERLFSLGRYEDVIALASSARPAVESGQSRMDLAFLLGHLASASYYTGRYDDSLLTYDDWYAAKGDDDTKIETVKFHFLKGLVRYTSGKSSEAGKLFEASLAAGDAKAHAALRPFQARARTLLASLYEQAGDAASALRHLEKAAELAAEAPLILTEIENQRGLVDQSAGRYQDAAAHFEKAGRLARESKEGGDSQAEAIAANHQGMLAREQGDYRRALNFMNRAVDLAQQGGEILQIARYRTNRALVLKESGRYAEALREMEEAGDVLEIYGGIEDRNAARLHRERLNGLLHDDPARGLALDQLAEREGLRFRAWETLRRFSTAAPESLRESDWTNAVATVEAVASPSFRLELFTHFEKLFRSLDLAGLALQASQFARQSLESIFQNLPEEIKMDFDKERSLQEMSASLESSAPFSKTAASEPKGNTLPISRFRLFCDFNRKIARMTDLKDLLEQVLDAALLITGAERGFLLTEGGENAKTAPIPGFEVAAARRFQKQSLAEKEFQISLTAVRQALKDGRVIVTDDARLDPRFQEKKSVVAYGLTAILVLPLELEGRPVGAIYLDHRSRPGLFTDEDVLLLNAFTEQAALAIQKARTLQALEEANAQLKQTVGEQAEEIGRLNEDLSKSRDDLRFGYEEIVGQSPSMMKVFNLLDHVTATAIPVWVHGESGTGKELVARALHRNSPRKDKPFVAENVSAIPETLLESELFGHKKGSFTHADRDRVGLFEQASGGTLFLDEVADMSLAMQAKLLRVLQEGEVRPVGASKAIKVDVRLVTASNRDLARMVKDGKFRQDLFFRVNGLTIKLPPLRERKADIPLLVTHLAKKISRQFSLPTTELTPPVVDFLLKHNWPGNVRELEASLRNLILLAKGQPVTKALLDTHPELFIQGSLTEPESKGGSPAPHVPVDDKDRKVIEDLLRKYRLDKKKIADELGMSLRTLYLRLEKMGLPRKKKQLEKYLGIA